MTLYINCCPRMNSRTDRLARALLKKLGEYEELRLYDEPIRAMDPQRLPHREELLDRLWEYPCPVDTRTVDTHIQRLRKKLGWQEHIKTVYKVGYLLEMEGEP